MSGVLISKAYAFAAKKHQGVLYRECQPYIWQIIDVAQRLRPLGAPYEICALLRDSVEDTDCTLVEIEEVFGPKVTKAVEASTRFAHEQYFRNYMKRVAEHKIACVVKYAEAMDKLDRLDVIADLDLRARKEEKFFRIIDTLKPVMPKKALKLLKR